MLYFIVLIYLEFWIILKLIIVLLYLNYNLRIFIYLNLIFNVLKIYMILLFVGCFKKRKFWNRKIILLLLSWVFGSLLLVFYFCCIWGCFWWLLCWCCIGLWWWFCCLEWRVLLVCLCFLLGMWWLVGIGCGCLFLFLLFCYMGIFFWG